MGPGEIPGRPPPVSRGVWNSAAAPGEACLMSRRQREPLAQHWKRHQQAREAREWSWGRFRCTDDLDFWNRIRQVPSELSGACLRAAAGLGRLQNGWHGVVIASGAKVAAAAGIAESTWWNYALDELLRVGFVQIQELGGGVLRGSPRRGHAHVYAVAGAVMKGPDGLTIVPHPRRRRPRSPAPPVRAAETAATAPALPTPTLEPVARATGPP